MKDSTWESERYGLVHGTLSPLKKCELATMASEITWWEKTVEYAFLLKYFNGDGIRQVWPLGGKAELMGDTIYGLNQVHWGLFEFKRDSESFNSEIIKFAVEAAEFTAAGAKVRELHSMSRRAARSGSSGTKATTTKRAASLHKIEIHQADTSQATRLLKVKPESEYEALQRQLAAAKAQLKKIQLSVFKEAQKYFTSTFNGEKYHFLIYGAPDSDGAGLTLYSRPYFDLLDGSLATDILVSNAIDETYTNWQKDEFAEYLRQFISFKRFGKAAIDDDGDGDGDGDDDDSRDKDIESKWKLGDLDVGSNPTYIIGVDSRKVIIAPLDKSKETAALLRFINSRPEPEPTRTLTVGYY